MLPNTFSCSIPTCLIHHVTVFCVTPIEYIPSALAKSHLPGAHLEWWISLSQHCVKLKCSALYPILSTGPRPVHTACCTLYITRWTLYTVHRTLYLHTARWLLHTALCVLHTTRCILHTACCILHTLYAEKCILHNVHFTVYIGSCIQHTAVPFPWGSLDGSFESLLQQPQAAWFTLQAVTVHQ